MKNTILTVILFVFTNLGYTQSINEKAVSNWDQCVSLSQTEFKHTCLGDDREKGWLSAHTTITNNCDQRIAITIKYQGKLKNGENPRNRSKIIKPNSSAKIYECHAIANQGSWGIISVESADRNYTSPTGNSSSSSSTQNKKETNSNNKDLDTSNDSYSNNTETIYEKRRREAQEKENRRKKEIRKQYDEVKRHNKNVDNNLKKNMKVIDNARKTFDTYFDSVAERQKKETQRARQEFEEESRREEEEKRQRKLRRLDEEKKEEEKRKEEIRIKNAKRQFMNDLKDVKIPLNYPNSKAYFIIITKTGEEKIQLSMFTLLRNSDNQLPYKQDILNKFKKENALLNQIYIQGPFITQQQQEKEYQNIKEYAKLSYIEIGKEITFKYNSSNNKTKNSNIDFWGNKKKKKTTKKSKKKSDFWN